MSEEIKNDVVNENEELKTEVASDKKEVSLIADIRSKIGYSGMSGIAIGLILLTICIPWGIGVLILTVIDIIYPDLKQRRMFIVATLIGLMLWAVYMPLGIICLIGVAGYIIYSIWKKKNPEAKAEELAKQMAKQMAKDKNQFKNKEDKKMSDGMNVNQGNANNEGCSGAIGVWCFLAFVASIIFGFLLPPEHPGFWVRLLLVIACIIGGTPCGTVGAVIGDILRKAAKPEFIITSGGMNEILNQKIFWAIGPQLIGTAAGAGIWALIIRGLLSKLF